MTERMPDDRARTARIALAVLAGALGTALFAAGLWMVFRPEPHATVQSEIEPAEETTPLAGIGGATLTASPSGEASDAGGAGVPGDPSKPAKGGGYGSIAGCGVNDTRGRPRGQGGVSSGREHLRRQRGRKRRHCRGALGRRALRAFS